MKVNRAIAQRIRQILKEKNISQYRLERNAAIPYSTMINIMNGSRESCKVKTLILIIRTLGITVSEFFNDPVFESDELEIDWLHS